eukprot:CAMPEP_0172152436 /NCGR_PEP_ID=MMETSP1050-20130122/839_1 /TAXON_ID=233186 /ORGANISM="Cryptomonas curvata, Strain CCAP979/52" /LENGTH=209 /DNA_ID=CAMNT_0012820763 /DNA_START=27 /DNA_END=653 /DNA_ORIENTATION=+
MRAYNSLDQSPAVLGVPLVYGKWRDGIFSCFCSGACASLFCAAFGPWCWPCLISKIAARINWDPQLPVCCGGWRGRTPHQQWIRFLMALCLAYFVLSFLHYAMLPVDYLTEAVDEEVDGAQFSNRSAALSFWSVGLSSLFSSGMSCIMLTFSIVICFLRFKVREQFQIPAAFDPEGPWRPSLMGRAEDCALCYCCSCCALAQMARHTHA